MPRVLSHVLLSVTLLLATPLLYIMVYILFDRALSVTDVLDFMLTNLVTAPILIAAWVLIWQRRVNWTIARYWKTGLAVLAAIVPGAVVYLVFAATLADEAGAVFGGWAWAVCWLTATAFIWRDTPLEQARRRRPGTGVVLRCPNCRYNLTGLYEARCPECGTRFTLDELFQAVAEMPDGFEQL